MNLLLPQSFNIEKFKEQLQNMDSAINNLMLKDLISGNAERRRRENLLYAQYQGKELAIQTRKMAEHDSINNKIACDYRGDIIDQFTGYLFGNPVKYTIKPERYEGGKDDPNFLKDTAFFDEFYSNNNFYDMDAETGKMQAICGRAARLCAILGKEKTALGFPNYSVLNINPSECIFIYDPSSSELIAALRYYYIYGKTTDGKDTINVQVEMYDRKNIYYFLSDNNLTNFVSNKPDEEHQFNFVPLFEVLNNEERQGDFEKVESLIDAYDRSVSDAQNEQEAFRNAYLITEGGSFGEREQKAIKQTGIINLPEGAKAFFATKSINDNFISNHLDLITKNIYRFSKTVDMTSSSFTGQGASGEARKWVLLGLENKASAKENKFKSALKYQFKVLSSAWSTIGVTLDWAKLSVNFDRNIPMETMLEADFLAKTKGLLSDRTRFENSKLVQNPDDELSRMEDEKEPSINLDEEDNNPKDIPEPEPIQAI